MHGHNAVGIVYDPIVVVAWGGDNMLGVLGSNNGPLYRIGNSEIWDRSLGLLRPLDASKYTYGVYCGSPHNVPFSTMGSGRNSPAFGFACRLSRETGRRVILVPSCTSGRKIDCWVANGTSSVDWLALEDDLKAVFEVTGLSHVDFLVGQHGEVDTIATDAITYASKLFAFIDQVRGAHWWRHESHLIFGEPCRAWDDTPSRDKLLRALESVRAEKIHNVSIAASLAGVGGKDNILPPATIRAPGFRYSGRALYSMGYFNYWQALPESNFSFADYWTDIPWGDRGALKYPTGGVEFTRDAHLKAASLYVLAPTVAKITHGSASRLFVGATTNSNKASEDGGSVGRLVWSDDDGETWGGSEVGGDGIGFIRQGGSVMEPCPWHAPDGKLWIFMTSSASLVTNDGRHGVHLSIIDNPMFETANVVQASKPKSVIPFGWCQKPQFFKGMWLLPVSYWQSATRAADGLVNFVPFLQGRHYFEIDWLAQKLRWAFHMGDIDPGHQFDEASISSLADGTAFGSWRTLEGPRYSLSRDDGKTWSAVSALDELGTQDARTAAVSRHKVVSALEKGLIFAWNRAIDRTNLTVAWHSNDLFSAESAQRSFHLKTLVGGSSSYPDLLVDGDWVYLVCDDGLGTTESRSLSRRIRLFKFRATELRDNSANLHITQTNNPINGS